MTLDLISIANSGYITGTAGAVLGAGPPIIAAKVLSPEVIGAAIQQEPGPIIVGAAAVIPDDTGPEIIGAVEPLAPGPIIVGAATPDPTPTIIKAESDE